MHDFVPSPDLLNEKLEAITRDDLASRFSPDLIATGIPTQIEYWVKIACADGNQGAGEIFVRGADSLFVVTTSHRKGDYNTGTGARLTVMEVGDVTPGPEWVVVTSAFSEYRDTAELDGKIHGAKFYDILPGAHIMLMVRPTGIVCSLPFLHDEPGQVLAIDPTSCRQKITTVSNVEPR